MKWLAPLALLLSTGCADVCTRAQSLSTNFQKRHAACYAEGTLPSPPFDAKACQSSMNACTSQDETALHTYFDCVDQLPVCTQANRTAFGEKFLACATGMGQLTEGCFRP